jgi:RND family efflux transporter MFP subunit
MPEMTNGQPIITSTVDAPNRMAKHDTEHALEMDIPKMSTGGMIALAIVLLALLGGLFLLGWIPHSRQMADTESQAQKRASTLPIVELVTPRVAPSQDVVEIPGDIRPNRSTAIFARATGFLKPLPEGIDIGARVRAGQPLAEISAPDLDAELAQARASIAQSRAMLVRAEQENLVSQTTLKRFETAANTAGAVSAQEVDERRSQTAVTAAAVEEARANIAVAEANVQRLIELTGFTRITAPFDGVITMRNFDPGALISGTQSAQGQQLFQIAQTDLLRVNVSVPQRAAPGIVIGQPAELNVASFPGRVFKGTIARTAGAIDPDTRTLRVEIDVPNESGELLPGMYTTVRLTIPVARPALIVPISSVLTDADGIRIATIDNNRLRYKQVTLGRDFGSEVEILTGLNAGEQIVKDPQRRPEGTEVAIAKPTAPAAAK